MGLRIKSISQTDAQTHLSLTGQQYQQDKVVLGKIVTSDMLDVIDASATQARALASDHKVVTVDLQDTAKNLARNWTFLQDLADNLTSVQVTDQNNAIRLTSDQFAASDDLLSKFVDDGQHTYSLAVTNVSAGTATTVAGASHVSSVEVADSGANIVANLDDLETLSGQGTLASVTVTNSGTAMSMDVSRFQDAAQAATQGVLDKVKGGNYKVAITGAGVSDAADLSSNKHIVQFSVTDSSDNVGSGLDTLYHLGSRLTSIEQTDVGAAFDLTQTELDSRASVLAKIRGGYTANLTGVTAAKAVADATNMHVGQIAITDTGRNILAKWSALRTLGAELTSITKSDGGAISLSADDYQAGVHDSLVGKFDQSTTFTVTGASIQQAGVGIIAQGMTFFFSPPGVDSRVGPNTARLSLVGGEWKLELAPKQTFRLPLLFQGPEELKPVAIAWPKAGKLLLQTAARTSVSTVPSSRAATLAAGAATISGASGPPGTAAGAGAGEGASDKQAPGVEAEAPTIDGELDPSLVSKEVRARKGSITACYERSLRSNPDLRGMVKVHWTITADGKASAVQIREDSMRDANVASCIQGLISRWRFPSPSSGSVEVLYPFVFRPSKQ